jgi:hypothetical protein
MIYAISTIRNSYVKYVPMNHIGDEAKEISDGVHPTACGYERMAYMWQYYMNRYDPNLVNAPPTTPFYPAPGTICADPDGQYDYLNPTKARR